MRIPKRSYYRWQAQTYEADRLALEKMDKHALALDITICRDRLLSSYRRMLALCQNDGVAVADRLAAEWMQCELAVLLCRLTLEGPTIYRELDDRLKEI